MKFRVPVPIFEFPQAVLPPIPCKHCLQLEGPGKFRGLFCLQPKRRMNAPFSGASGADAYVFPNTGRDEMKTLTATLALTVLFLSAGAFAGNHQRMASPAPKANMTVIEKNQSWPAAGWSA
ncbi:MAG: hypothetical protein ACREDX_08165 [Aestuariivirga sp.]